MEGGEAMWNRDDLIFEGLKSLKGEIVSKLPCGTE